MDDLQALLDMQKRAAAVAAVAEIGKDMIVGLGTGSTAAHAIAALAQRVREGLSIQAVATSLHTERHARQAGITVLNPEEVGEIDLAIDGVDEIDTAFRAIKGAGGAMLREKIVATTARRMIAIADSSKAVARLGTHHPVPVEVLPFARSSAIRQLTMPGCEPIVRLYGAEPVLTDQGNIIIDCHFAVLDDPAALAARLDALPGILGHGLFLSEIDALYLGTVDGVVCTERPS